MYKLLLCWRYLRTRYLALVCIVSVMLGVATLIVVNSVMAGFSNKLRDRLHGLLSDVVLEAYDYDGFPDPEGKMALIRADPFLAERVEAMTPTLEIFAMVQFFVRESPFAREAPSCQAFLTKPGPHIRVFDLPRSWIASATRTFPILCSARRAPANPLVMQKACSSESTARVTRSAFCVPIPVTTKST